MKSASRISIAASLFMGLGLATQASATLTVQNFWHMGEDGNVLPTDAVGGKNFTGGFSTAVSSVHSPDPGSTASIYYNGFAGNYMANAADDITVAATNWVLELWVNFNTLNGQVNIGSLGTDTSGNGSIKSWAKIGFSGNNFFFGRENDTYGVLSDLPVTTAKWYELAYVQHDGLIHGYVNGIEATDLNYATMRHRLTTAARFTSASSRAEDRIWMAGLTMFDSRRTRRASSTRRTCCTTQSPSPLRWQF